MNKKTIITIGIVIAVLAIAGLLGYNFYKSSQAKKSAETMNQSIESLNLDACADITVQSEFVSKDACYNYIAQTTNNKALCEKIKQQELKDNCYENVE